MSGESFRARIETILTRHFDWPESNEQPRLIADDLMHMPEMKIAEIAASSSRQWLEEHFGAELAEAIHEQPKE